MVRRSKLLQRLSRWRRFVSRSVYFNQQNRFAHRHAPVVRGWGHLVKEITLLARQLGCATVQWQTPIWNERAVRFYQCLGAIGKQNVRFFLAGEVRDTLLASERNTPYVRFSSIDSGDEPVSR